MIASDERATVEMTCTTQLSRSAYWISELRGNVVRKRLEYE
jgi:hypothetical protein